MEEHDDAPCVERYSYILKRLNQLAETSKKTNRNIIINSYFDLTFETFEIKRPPRPHQSKKRWTLNDKYGDRLEAQKEARVAAIKYFTENRCVDVAKVKQRKQIRELTDFLEKD